MELHAFLAMPRGCRQGIDFTAIHDEFFAPAIARAGFELLPANDTKATNARPLAEVIDERLLADLVVIDLTSDDARRCLERGLQHALLARVIAFTRGLHEGLIQTELPQFDPGGAPVLDYHLRNGRPDPAFLEADKQALASLARTLVDSASQPADELGHISTDTVATHPDYRPAEQGLNARKHSSPRRKPGSSSSDFLDSGVRRNDASAPNPRLADALAIVDRSSVTGTKPEPIRQLVLFSGHMIDTADRIQARFPANMERTAAEAIAAKLDQVALGQDDFAICGGACGGDLLFAEAALARGCRVQLHLQFDEAAFLQASVAFAGKRWIDRYHAVRNHPLTSVRIQPDVLGPPARGMNPYVRNNLWQLYTAITCGADALLFIALWDGQDSNNPGGTQNMVSSIRQQDGQVSILNTRRLFNLSPAPDESLLQPAAHALS